MMDSVASLDGSVQAIDDGVNHMQILDEEVFPGITRSYMVG